MPGRKSAVEQRRGEIERQLARLRAQLARKSRKDFTTDFRHGSWLEGTNALIGELLDELSALADPGEYDELPAAVVADELELTRAQVRALIRLGEIEASGRPAHERIGRAELGRIAGLGAQKLLRLGRQESAEIFEEAVPLLRHRGSDLGPAERAYRRLERREGWAAPYAPAFLVGLELARDDPAGAISTVRLIYGIEDHLQRLAVMSYLGRALQGVGLSDGAARQVCTWLADLAERGAAGRGLPVTGRRGRPEARDPEELQRKAAYLAASVMIELRGRGIFDERPAAGGGERASEDAAARAVRDAIYSALYAEAFYDDSPSCRMYADMTRAAAAGDQGEAKLLTGLSAGRGRR
jgi:hypothetical protein